MYCCDVIAIAVYTSSHELFRQLTFVLKVQCTVDDNIQCIGDSIASQQRLLWCIDSSTYCYTPSADQTV